MNKFIKKLGNGVLAGVIFVLLMAAVLAFSWICTCGIIYLITMCFGWTFKWSVATGIWLLMSLARTVFKSNTTVKK